MKCSWMKSRSRSKHIHVHSFFIKLVIIFQGESHLGLLILTPCIVPCQYSYPLVPSSQMKYCSCNQQNTADVMTWLLSLVPKRLCSLCYVNHLDYVLWGSSITMSQVYQVSSSQAHLKTDWVLLPVSSLHMSNMWVNKSWCCCQGLLRMLKPQDRSAARTLHQATPKSLVPQKKWVNK